MEKCAVVTGSRGVSDGYHAVAFGENLRLDLLKDITFWKDDVFAFFQKILDGKLAVLLLPVHEHADQTVGHVLQIVVQIFFGDKIRGGDQRRDEGLKVVLYLVEKPGVSFFPMRIFRYFLCLR